MTRDKATIKRLKMYKEGGKRYVVHDSYRYNIIYTKPKVNPMSHTTEESQVTSMLFPILLQYQCLNTSRGLTLLAPCCT